jgi:hypothetical protein
MRFLQAVLVLVLAIPSMGFVKLHVRFPYSTNF